MQDNNDGIDYDEILTQMPMFTDLFPSITTSIVVDSNVLIGDLRYMVRKEGKPTQLLKLIRSKRALLFFPMEKVCEIAAHLEKVAVETDSNPETVKELWNETYAPLVKLVPETVLTNNVPLEDTLRGRDPEDIAFLRLFSFLRPDWFLTEDKDLIDLGVAASGYPSIAYHLTGLHVGETITCSIVAGGSVICVAGFAAIAGLYETVKAAVGLISKAPDWVKAVLLLLIVAMFASSKVRAFAKDLMAKVPHRWNDSRGAILDYLNVLIDRFDEGDSIKNEALNELKHYRPQSALPHKSPKAYDYALQVLMHSPEPLLTQMVAQRVIFLGYETTNERFDQYVASILRQHKEFAMVERNKWVLGFTGAFLD